MIRRVSGMSVARVRPTNRLVVLLATAILVGCDSGGGRDGIAASAVQDPVLRDIPKPSGFRLVDKNSMAKASGQFRIAQCEYVGSRERDAVRRFYEEYMPTAGFQLKHWSLEKGTYALAFESATEMCEVAIGPDGLRTTVRVKVGPKADSSIGSRSDSTVEHPPTVPVERRPPPRRRGNDG